MAALSIADPSAAQPFFSSVQELSLPTNDLVYDPISGRIYASVSSRTFHELGNRIAVIDPETATVVDSFAVGSEPGPLALSDDGQVLWVGLNGARAIRRVEVPTLTPGLQFPVGTGSLGVLLAEDIAVQPGSRDVIAVSRQNVGFSPRHEGVAIYDNGAVRSAKTPGHTGANRIEFSDSPTMLYGLNNETTEFGFRRITVSATGAVVTSVDGRLISGFGTDFLFDDGLVYATTGVVVDPEGAFLVGTFNASGPVRPASDLGLVFFLDRPFGGLARLAAFDSDTFTAAGFIGLGSASNLEALGRMVRFGTWGLAVRMGSRSSGSDRIVFVKLSEAPPPDQDEDGVPDDADNCPAAMNPGQEDADADDLGDACDRFPEDEDNLGVCVQTLDGIEGEISRLEQELAAALADTDEDGIPDPRDRCPDSRRKGRSHPNGCQPWQLKMRGR